MNREIVQSTRLSWGEVSPSPSLAIAITTPPIPAPHATSLRVTSRIAECVSHDFGNVSFEGSRFRFWATQREPAATSQYKMAAGNVISFRISSIHKAKAREAT
jgi:hypothetical protein